MDTDLGAISDAHVHAEFTDLDLEATMATMVEEPYVNHVAVIDRRGRAHRGGPLLQRALHRSLGERHADGDCLGHGRRAAVVIGFRDQMVTHERIYWDQASLLVQIGLLDAGTLPVTGVERARKVLDPSLPANALIERAQSQ